jgi:peptidoglycan/xylan/chitin deacetylase (PgdA/CDA1 family)
MLQNKTIFCPSIPDKTLALTFDDGPGPHTLALAEYLASESVFVTFFFVGRHAHRKPEIVRKVHDLGHLIGSHTYDHADLTKTIDPITAIFQGEIIIRNQLKLDIIHPILFRAPYGNWNADIAQVVPQRNLLKTTIGPIGWNIPRYSESSDWYYWRQNRTPGYAAKEFFNEIQFKQKGIICLHDNDHVGKVNRTFEMIPILIPMLKERGYRFIRLDETQEIKAEICKIQSLY